MILTSGAVFTTLYFLRNLLLVDKARVCAIGRLFQSSLMPVGKAMSLSLSGAHEGASLK
jgi:hypothetical protein